MKEMTKPSTEHITFEKVLEKNGVLVYTNVGTSMMPLLRQRKDIIEIRQKEGKCKKYDVVFYKRGDRYILHRILRVLPNGYLIAGDHCTFVEKDVTDNMILGVMTRVLRNGKSITPDNFRYKIYTHLWCDCYPVRMFIIKAKYRIKGILRAVKRRLLRYIWKDTGEDSSPVAQNDTPDGRTK